MNKTQVRRLEITTDVEQKIVQLCDTMHAAGYAVKASFTVGNQLVLIFQEPLVS